MKPCRFPPNPIFGGRAAILSHRTPIVGVFQILRAAQSPQHTAQAWSKGHGQQILLMLLKRLEADLQRADPALTPRRRREARARRAASIAGPGAGGNRRGGGAKRGEAFTIPKWRCYEQDVLWVLL